MFDPVLRWAQKVLDPRFSHFVAPLPKLNEQSLTACIEISDYYVMYRWRAQSV